jgi:hypothetical protein
VQLRTDGAVQFSAADQAQYGATTVTVTRGDLPIERGVAMRFFRSPVNLDGTDPSVKDVSLLYTTQGAVFASPIIQVPYVLLPATPLQDPGYPISIYVEQGTGSFTGVLPDLGVPAPPVGLGYILDYEAKQLLFAQRKVNQLVPFQEPGGTIQLQDVPVRPENLLLELETGPGTGIFNPLGLGSTAFFDPATAIVTLTDQFGTLVVDSTATAFVGSTLTDTSVNFITSGVTPGALLVIATGSAAGVYGVTTVTATTLTTDVPSPIPVGATPYEVRSGSEVIADRFFQETVPVDPNTKIEKVRSLGPIVNSVVVFTGVNPGVFDTPTTMTDTSTDFVVDGVLPGDTVRLTSGPDSNSYRTVTIVEASTLTVDRAFTSYPSANYQIERRLRVPVNYIATTRIRLGLIFASLVQVATNSVFTAPGLLPAGTVEVSLETGDLNFSTVDITSGVTVFWARALKLQIDYRVSKDLGFVELTERLLTNDEMFITYRPVTSTGVLPPVEERVRFLIRKELTLPYPRLAVTDTVQFNPAGRTVADNPAPAVFRGGRPQDSSQITIHSATSTIQFLANVGFMTNALPSGNVVEVDERILVDYYVYEAVGGEKTFTVLQPPIFAAQVSISSGAPGFVLVGDQTATFPPNYLLRIEKEQVYLIGSSVYDPGSDQTTITLAFGATFADDFVNPRLYLSSGLVRTSPSPSFPSYFVIEMSSVQTVPRGMPRVLLAGDQTLNYPTGTIILFTDNATTYDFYYVSGATFKDGVTTVVFTQNALRQYTPNSMILKRSVRPIIEDGVTQAFTKNVPLGSEVVTVFRRTEGQPGEILSSPSEYKLDASGTLTYAQTLRVNESLSILYTGYRIVQAGVRLRASYVALITPSSSNGLEGQILKADYSLVSEDSFYYRVETLTNFSGEVLQELQQSAQGSSPSGGPTTSNASTPTLYQQGRESLFFTEGHMANVDYVSRSYLKFFNDNTNRLEDVLEDEDGRIIGDVNGRFRFDGSVTNPVRTSYATVTNEIDDVFKISDYPVTFTFPPLALTYVGTYLALYQPSGFSRLYPTAKAHLFGVTTGGANTGANTGDRIEDLAQKSLTSLSDTIYRRLPRAHITSDAATGDTTLFVDNAQGTSTFFRPSFAVGMKVVITNRDGVVLISDATPLTVTAVLASPERIQVGPLPIPIPRGATVYLCNTGLTPDTVYWKLYRQGFDIAVDSNEGQLIYVKPYPPFDGSTPLVPAPLQIQTPNAGEFLEMDSVGILQVAKTPYKFPALYGGTGSDCNDQSIPILSPAPTQEVSALTLEATAIASVLSDTTTPTTLVGVTVGVTGTVLTYTGVFPAPLPQVFDLVEFITGPNAGSGFRRITAVGPTTVTVDSAFPNPSSVGNAVITATTNLATGTATFPSATTLDDPGLSVAIQVGHTVVLTTGANAGVRRQVVARLSPTQLQLDHPVPFLVATNYRVSNHLCTYSNWSAVSGATLTEVNVLTVNDHDITPSVVDAVSIAIDRFFEGHPLPPTTYGVLTDLLTPTLNPGNVAGSTLTDLSQDFIAAGVNASHFVYVETGADAGFYQVDSVVSPTQLTITTPFPVVGPVTYRIVQTLGVGLLALQDLFQIRADAQSFSSDTQSFLGIITATTNVFVPPGVIDPFIYANPLSSTTLPVRAAAVAARTAVVTSPTASPVVKVEAIVKTRDKLYDKRYAWIDARTNLETGSLYVIQRAVANRIAATTKLYNDLLKILSVQTTV